MTRYFYNSNDQTFEQFISDSILKESNGKLLFKSEDLKGLLNENFDNILYQNKHEIFIEHYEDTLSYDFKITKIPSKYNINFGCELETCFIMDCKNIDLDLSYKTLQKLSWTEKVLYYLQNNIVPYLKVEFLEKFKYAAIYDNKYFKTGFLLDMKNNRVLSNATKFTDYNTLIFLPDGTIDCNVDENTITLPCEIVTPILDKIEDLKILFEGLSINEKCNLSNASMGFHINVSTIDNNNNRIPFTYGFLNEFLIHYLPYENKNYESSRPYGFISYNPGISLSKELTNLYEKSMNYVSDKSIFNALKRYFLF
jgi:hypothetical protein